jgi:ribulose-phosphate 3-epimerase
VQLVKSLGKKCGVALNPATPVDAIDYVLGDIDLVLVMSVDPGFGGQHFIPASIEKIRAVRRRIDESKRKIDLEVDGGINVDTARQAIAAGADVLVAGTGTFAGGAAAYAGNIRQLRGEGAARAQG